MYTPVLRNRQSELLALRHLHDDVKRNSLPLLDLAVPGKASDRAAIVRYVNRNIGRMRRALSGFDAVLLDSSELDADFRLTGGVHPLTAAADALQADGLAIIPVTGLHRDQAHRQAALHIKQNHGGNCWSVRLDPTDIATAGVSHRQLMALLQSAGISTEETIVLLDLQALYGHDPASKTAQCLRLVRLLQTTAWRGIIVAGYGIPDQITQAVAVREQGYIDRIERTIYQAVRRVVTLDNLWFSDYTTLSPTHVDLDWKVVSKVMSPRALYALTDSWFVVRGGPFSTHDDGYEQYFSIAKEIVALEEFCGDSYSSGDHYIYERSQRHGTAGNPGSWITACVSHHISLTSRHYAT